MLLQRLLARVAVIVSGLVGANPPALAGSDRSSDTYAGDYSGGSLPDGTFAALQYLRFAHADAFFNTAGKELPNSHANIFVEFTRLAYISQIDGHPFVIEGDLPFATLTDVNVPGTNNRVAGGLVDPVLHFTYFFVTPNQEAQQWLGFTNYFYLPLGRSFDNQKAINIATARQFTDVLQIGYTEGLGNFSHALNDCFFDLIANTSLHADGNNPLDFPLATYNTLTQRPSFDVEAFLRYAPPHQLGYVAIGIEKAWGGKQVATNGYAKSTGLPITGPTASIPLTKDELLRGHLQFQVPMTRDFALATDIFHDFNRVGGLRENIGVELRFLKLFLPPLPPK